MWSIQCLSELQIPKRVVAKNIPHIVLWVLPLAQSAENMLWQLRSFIYPQGTLGMLYWPKAKLNAHSATWISHYLNCSLTKYVGHSPDSVFEHNIYIEYKLSENRFLWWQFNVKVLEKNLSGTQAIDPLLRVELMQSQWDEINF